MPVIELIHKRVGNDIRILVQLFDNDVPVNWTQVTHIFPSLFSDPQRVVMGKCHIDGIDPQDPTTLMLSYSGKSPQYRGLARLVIELRYMEHTCTVDAPAFVFVDKTADEGVGPVNVEIISHVDPEVNSLQIVVGGGGSASWGTITGDITYQTDLMEALAGKQDTIEDFSAIEAGAAAGATAYQLPASGMPSTDMSEEVQTSLGKADTAVQPGSLKQVAFSGNYNDLTNRPAIPAAQVNSNWNAESGVAQILNKPNLATVATSGSYNDLSNKPSIPAAPGTLDTTNTEGQATSASEALSGTINLHKVSKTGNYSDLRNKPTIPEAPEQSDWTQTDDTKLDYIKHKPNLASVAVSGSYDDLRDKPTIPVAQVQSDWNQASSSEKSYIKNKPNLATVATSGSYNDLSNKPTIPTVHNMASGGTTGQVLAKKSNTDYDTEWVNQSGGGAAVWGSITGDLDDQTDLKDALDAKQDVISNLATIESGAAAGATAVQPGDLASVATSGQYSDLTGTPSLATVATTGDYDDLLNKPSIPAAQVNSDWNAVSGVAQILNKPTIPAAPGTLDTTATTAQATSSSEALSGSVTLHKISKTGDYDDLLNKPTIPSVTLNGSATSSPSFYAPTTAGTSGYVLTSNGSGAPTWQAAPSGGGDVTDVTLGGTSVVDGNGVAVLPAYPVVESLTTAEIDTIWASA